MNFLATAMKIVSNESLEHILIHFIGLVLLCLIIKTILKNDLK
jgi:hypothetical protein